MLVVSKTGGGRGTNQYRTRGASVRHGSSPPILTLPNKSSRVQAASDTTTDPATLATLATRAEGAVRAQIAANPSTPIDILRYMAHSREPYVQVLCNVAKNRATPKDEIQYLADYHQDWRVRRAAAANPNCPTETLETLLVDSDPRIHPTALGHPNAPASALRSHSVMNGNKLRHQSKLEAIAGNPSCPTDVLVSILTNNPAPRIRRKALNNPAIPDHIRAIYILSG